MPSIQVELLQADRDQLCSSGLSAEGKPVPPIRTGPEQKQPEERRCSAALQADDESRLQPADAEVSAAAGGTF